MYSTSPTANPMSGILLIDKPQDWTSHDVVAKVRRVFNTKKVGHAGTLDPMATGVLVVLVGRQATKLSDKLLSEDKEYIAEIRLGQETDTGDAEGMIVREMPVGAIDRTMIEEACSRLTGQRPQQVPAYAAVKVGGKKLYELARQGKVVERPVKSITITAIDILDFNPQKREHLTVKVQCSKGTYIRVLAEEIAAELGTVGHLTGLRRTKSGQFSIEQTSSMKDLLEHDNPEQLLLKVDESG